MKAVVWHGKRDVRVDTVPDPTIQEPTDAIVRITSTGLCGSDLHLYEVMGAVHDPGRHPRPRADGHRRGGRRGVTHIAPGDRVVIPFNISCGHCGMCDAGSAVAVRDHPGARARQGRRAVRLHQALRAGRRRARPSCCGCRRPSTGRSRCPTVRPTTGSCTSPTSCRRRGRRCSTPPSRPAAPWSCSASARSARWPAGVAAHLGASQGHRRRPGARAARAGPSPRRRRRSTCATFDDDQDARRRGDPGPAPAVAAPTP